MPRVRFTGRFAFTAFATGVYGNSCRRSKLSVSREFKQAPEGTPHGSLDYADIETYSPGASRPPGVGLAKLPSEETLWQRSDPRLVDLAC